MLDKQNSFIVSRHFAIGAQGVPRAYFKIVHKQIIAKLKCEITMRRVDLKIVGQDPQALCHAHWRVIR